MGKGDGECTFHRSFEGGRRSIRFHWLKDLSHEVTRIQHHVESYFPSHGLQQFPTSYVLSFALNSTTTIKSENKANFVPLASSSQLAVSRSDSK